MPAAVRRRTKLLATLACAWAATGCGGSVVGNTASSSDADSGFFVGSGVTDGRIGPAMTATESEGARELDHGGRPDASDPPRTGSRREGVGAGDACPQVDALPLASNLGQIEATTLCLLNGVRTDDGLKPLMLDAALARAARGHSEDMVANTYFSHQGRNGSAFQDRIAATGYLPKNTAWTIGENLAWGTGALATPKSIVNAWMNSKGHRDNILKPEYREIGFGIVLGNPATPDGTGATYTSEFGARGVAGGAPAPKPVAAAPPARSKPAPRRVAPKRVAVRKAKRARTRAKRPAARRSSAGPSASASASSAPR